MSSTSARSRLVRQVARNRPDKIWLEQGQWHSHVYQKVVPAKKILSGGSRLSQLIAEADAHLVAMRKTVL